MKSVLKTFSQSTLNVMTKVCLTVCCVFVLSTLGSAQSFMEAPEAYQVLKPIVKDLQIEFMEDNKGARVNTASTDALSMRYHYFASLQQFFAGEHNANSASIVIEKNHIKWTSRIASTESSAAVLAQLKQEATNLLSN